MSNQTNNNNNVSQNIKETAGTAFHSVHNALAATENMAMNAVDGTTNAINSTANAVRNAAGNNNNRNNQNK